jgi:ABC-type nitrate/sulfonate/bicarbonate transport system ATPase subunit
VRDRKEQRFEKKKTTMTTTKETFLDWNDTAREVRTLGSLAFMGKEKREYRQEEYMRLTGRKEKQQRVPLPIQRGIKKKAAQRLERQLEEARQAGIILPVAKKEKPRLNKDQGPAPSIGYMKKGVFRVKGAN